MYENLPAKVTKTENGFTVNVDHRDYIAGDLPAVAAVLSRAFGIGTFTGMDFGDGQSRTTISGYHAGPFYRHAGMKDDRAPDQTPAQMRDELGELRRFKEKALRRGEEQNETIRQLTEQLFGMSEQRDYAKKRFAEFEGKNSAEVVALRAMNDKLNKKINEFVGKTKKSRRRKAK